MTFKRPRKTVRPSLELHSMRLISPRTPRNTFVAWLALGPLALAVYGLCTGHLVLPTKHGPPVSYYLSENPIKFWSAFRFSLYMSVSLVFGAYFRLGARESSLGYIKGDEQAKKDARWDDFDTCLSFVALLGLLALVDYLISR